MPGQARTPRNGLLPLALRNRKAAASGAEPSLGRAADDPHKAHSTRRAFGSVVPAPAMAQSGRRNLLQRRQCSVSRTGAAAGDSDGSERDGLERKRKKWGKAARTWYRFSERLATLCPDSVVTDARVIPKVLRRASWIGHQFIAYGAPRDTAPTTAKLAELSLHPEGTSYMSAGSSRRKTPCW